MEAEAELDRKMDKCKDAEERVDLVRYLFNNPDQTFTPDPTTREVVETEDGIQITLHRGDKLGFDFHTPPKDEDTKNGVTDKQKGEEPAFHTSPEDIDCPLNQAQPEEKA